MDSYMNAPASIDKKIHKDLLDDIQGNILKGHGRKRVCLLLVQFFAGASKAREWVRLFGGEGLVTTAGAQEKQKMNWLKQQEEQKQQQAGWHDADREELFANLFLTPDGYKYLGVKDEWIPGDKSFRAGMASSYEKLNDLKPSAWEPSLQVHPVHAMVLLAASERNLFETKCRSILESLEIIADVKRQNGQAIMKGFSQGLTAAEERYVGNLNELEGISQPVFFQDEFAQLAGKNTKFYDPSAPPNLVLVKEPSGSSSESTGYGSYLVYRKLEQNLRGVKQREMDFALNNKSSSADAPPLLARALGRFDTGRPLPLPIDRQLAPDLPDDRNDFNYNDDPEGLKCPLNAHIRKVNPRDDNSRPHRIARRSITYGSAKGSAPEASSATMIDALPTHEVGVLFMCFQSSIENQFEHLQMLANNPDAPVAGAGCDALIGQAPKLAKANFSPGSGKDNNVSDFVVLKGGGYFFAPSVSFFRNLPA